MALTPATVRLDACWKGYVQVGTKRKGKRRVPNCIPASSGVAKPRRQADSETRMDPRGSKVAAMEAELAKQAAARGLKGARAEAYIYGTLNKMGYMRGSKTTRKGAAKAKRTDAEGLACGQSHIARGKTCLKRGAFPTRTAIAAGLVAGGLTALTLKGSRNAILGAPGAARRGAQRAITEVVHRATAKPPSMSLTGAALRNMRPPSKTERLRTAARTANREAERAIARAAQSEIERAATVGSAMYKAGKATRASLRSGMRTHNLTVEKLRRRYEPGYRRGRRDASGMQFLHPTYIDPAAPRSDADGKKYTKKVRDPETGRTRTVRYGAKGYRIAPGTDKGDRYCARSFGDMKSHGKNCAGADRNTPLCLSRAKWKCSGKTSRRDSALTPGKS
jgi:hypothetical protein